jgi:hypothetical protein
MKVPPYRRSRRGAAIVEMAAVSVLFFMFLFGIVEYCRLLFYMDVMDNAAREGARHGVVNTMKDDLDTVIKERVNNKMVGVENAIDNFNVSIYRSNSTGKNLGSANGAEFGEFIIVQVEGDYKPILPSFLFLNQTLHLKSRALMNSEAN